MKRYLKLTNQLVDYIDDVKFEQIPWENNLDADKVAKLALYDDTTKKPGLYMEVQTVPSIEGLQAFPVSQLCTWMDPILSYIKMTSFHQTYLRQRRLKLDLQDSLS